MISTRTTPRIRYHGVDLLRFVAAAAVVFYHFAYLGWATPSVTSGWPVQGMPAFPELRELASAGWVGVESFFVISGFVIAYSAETSTGMQFARSRFLRLAPALWIAAPLTAVALVIYGTDVGYVIGALARSLVLWPAGPWVDGTYWTLCVEVVFYALVLGVILLKQTSRLEAVLTALGLGSAAICIIALLPTPFAHDMRLLLESWAVRLSLIRNGCEFGLGALLYFSVARPKSGARLLAIAFCIAGSLAEVQIRQLEVLAPGDSYLMRVAPLAGWVMMMLGLLAAIHPRSAGVFAHPRRARWLLALGLSTYPLYLIHENLGWIVMSHVFELSGSRWFSLGMAVLAVGLLTSLIVGLEPKLRAVLARGSAKLLAYGVT